MIFQWRALRSSPLNLAAVVGLGLLIALAIGGRVLDPFNPLHVGSGPALHPPGAQYWFGTDELGRDVLSRVIVGTGVSLEVGFGSAAIAAAIGLLAGGFAGYLGGFVDDVLTRVTELFMVIPGFFLAVVFVALFGPSILNIIAVLGVLGWPIIARIVRSEFLSLKHRSYVDAARVVGASPATIIFGEILPNAASAVIVAATLQVGTSILLEAALSYLGLGDPNRVSLGLELQQSQPLMSIAWWTAIFPGVILFIAIFSINLLGDALNDVLNPRGSEGYGRQQAMVETNNAGQTSATGS